MPDRRLFALALMCAGCNLFTPFDTGHDLPDAGSQLDLGADAADSGVGGDATGAPDLGESPDTSQADSGIPRGPRVQTGRVALTEEDTVVETLSHPVNLGEAALFFSLTTEAQDPAAGLLRGRLLDESTVEFARIEAGPAMEVRWYVVELPGATVQRGDACIGGTDVTCPGGNPPLDPLVLPIATTDVGQSFPLVSHVMGGTEFGEDDFIELRLAATSLSAYFADALGGMLSYEVVEVPGATVQSGSLTLADTSTSTTVAPTAYDVDRTFALATWRSHDGSSLIGPHVVRARLDDSGALVLERGVGGAILDITWYVVQLPVGYLVQAVDVSMDASTTQTQAAVDAVPIDNSFVFLSGNERDGMTTYRGAPGDPYGDVIGAGRMVAELVDAGDGTGEIVLVRRATHANSPAEATAYVVTVP